MIIKVNWEIRLFQYMLYNAYFDLSTKFGKQLAFNFCAFYLAKLEPLCVASPSTARARVLVRSTTNLITRTV